MVLDKLLTASYKGIQFHVEEARDEITWNHQTNEYITGQDARTTRFSKAARSFLVSGFLLGRDANLIKDFLTAATDEDAPGKLIHPLYGMKNVVCISRKYTTLGVSAYQFEMEFKEAQEQEEKGFLDEAADRIEHINAAITDAGLTFFKHMQKVLAANHLLDEAVKTIEKIDSFIESANGLSIIPRTVGSLAGSADKTRKMVRRPKILYSSLVSSSASIVRTGGVAKLAEGMRDSGLGGLVAATFAGLVLAEAAKEEGPFDEETYAPFLDQYFDFADKGGPEIGFFAEALWVKVNCAKRPEPKKHDNKPSLVAAYEQYGDLGKERELARGAKQPFGV